MNEVESAQYKNLRDGFRYMSGVVLGHDWYNHEHDVYRSDTETIRCMIVKFRKAEGEANKYKVLSCILSVSLFISVVFMFIP